MYVYVNAYTHEYEITNIPTTYPIRHVGTYVGSFASFQALEDDEYRIGKHRVFDRISIDDMYGPNGKRPNFCFICHKEDHWASKCPEKDNQITKYQFVYVNPHTHDITMQSALYRTPIVKQDMIFVGAFTSFCNDYNRYCLRTYQQKWNSTSVKKTPDIMDQVTQTDQPDKKTVVDQITPSDQSNEKTVLDQITPSDQSNEKMDAQTDEKTKLKKQNCFICKTDKHKQKICPDIVVKPIKPRKRKSTTETENPTKKRKGN